MERFPTQETCIAYLESAKWGKNPPDCPHCGTTDVKKRTETETGRIGRWNCHDCQATFKVTHGTVFHGTKIALQKWFLAISLIANAKKSFVKLSVVARFRLESKDGLVHDDTYPGRDGEKRGLRCYKASLRRDENLYRWQAP